MADMVTLMQRGPVVDPGLLEVAVRTVLAGTSYATDPALSFSDGGNVSFGLSGNTMTASVGGSDFPAVLSISAGTAVVSSQEVVFSNANGVSFGADGTSVVTASVQAIKTIAAHGGATATGPSFSFADGNGVTFGLAGNTLTASVQTAGGTATGVGISAGTQVATTGAVVFANSNGVTFGLNNQTLTATVAPAIEVSAGSQLASSGTLVFSNANGVTFGMSGSSQITASAYQPSVQRVVGFTATGGETDFSVTFAPNAANTNYSVMPALNGVSMIFGLDLPAGSANRAVSAFRVVPTASLQAGDQIAFFLFAS